LGIAKSLFPLNFHIKNGIGPGIAECRHPRNIDIIHLLQLKGAAQLAKESESKGKILPIKFD
jgi:hypothetical protein